MPAVAAFKKPTTSSSTGTTKSRPRLFGPEPDAPHQCMVCGSKYPKQPGYFPKIVTKMYKGNNYYAAICNTCCTEYYQNWLKEYKDESMAIRRCCEWMNIYFDPTAVGRAGGGFVGYMDDMDQNARNYSVKSWDTTIAEEAEAEENAKVVRTAEADALRVEVEEGEKIFGEGFPDDAYPEMLRTYHGYIDQLGDTATAAQLKSARFLAALEYRCMEAIKADKPNASALSSSLTRAIKESGFDTVQERESSNEKDTYGVWLAEIEEYTPAEYVKKHPYKDIDNYDRYYDRFVRRSVENLLNRSSQKQEDELSISDEEARSLDVGDSDDAT